MIEKNGDLLLVNMSFAPRDSPIPVKEKCPCHPLLLVMGVTIIPDIHSLARYCERYSERYSPGREFRYFYLNQLVAPAESA